MPVNHVMKYLKSVHTVSLFFWLFSETLNFYFKMEEDFLKKIFGSNYYIWLVLWLVWRPAGSKNLEWPLIYMYIGFYLLCDRLIWAVQSNACKSAPVNPSEPLATTCKSLWEILPIKGDFSLSAFRIDKRSSCEWEKSESKCEVRASETCSVN